MSGWFHAIHASVMAARRERGLGEEVAVPVSDGSLSDPAPPSVERHVDDVAARRGASVVGLADREQPPLCHVSPPNRMPWSAGVSDARLRAGLERPDALVGLLDEEQHAVIGRGPDPPPYSCTRERAFHGAGSTSLDLARSAAAPAHRRAAALLGHALAPPDVVSDEPRALDARRGRCHVGGGRGDGQEPNARVSLMDPPYCAAAVCAAYATAERPSALGGLHRSCAQPLEVIGDIAESEFSHRHRTGRPRHPLASCPSVAEVEALLERAVAELPLRQVWVNPDCGLKTRGYAETVASLQNIVEATREVRDRVDGQRLGDFPSGVRMAAGRSRLRGSVG